MSPTIVSGAISTVAELGKDEAWLQGWLKEHPTRLGLGELSVDANADEGDAAGFLAADDERCFSVDVCLGEVEASQAFAVLDTWARNRLRQPDKDHVAVLVTESIGERYRATLETLSEHLPLVVVELQVWLGESEAIVVPHVALASESVDLGSAPAVAAAAAMAKVAADTEAVAEDLEDDPDELASEMENKDDTGIDDPWRLPKRDESDSGSILNGSLTGAADR